ncbi:MULTISPECIES: YibE/F family protein [Arthrobacter]|uniref:YibE/F family protein n=2 Tax=Arthrobacter TaxID=1663 RepID=A0ABU9KN44_9MICC|nr:YibE/F family protein [Arthrobacter sp. YJM1]MDP5228271.1 YibE/F family protein [Arthrobacter sp. YJM1]
MGHGHSHDGGPPPTLQAAAARRRAGWILAAILLPVTLLTAVGMILLWPGGQHQDLKLSSPYAAAPGVSFDTGKVLSVTRGSCSGGPADSSQSSQGSGASQGSDSQSSQSSATQGAARLSTCFTAVTQPDAGGPSVQVLFNPEVSASDSVHAGDGIRYLNLSRVQQGAVQQGGQAPAYVFVDFVRTFPVAVLAVLYAAVVILVARWRGFRALLGLGVAYLVLAFYLLPGLVDGKPALPLALTASTAILIAVLYFAHGFSARTSTALLGTVFGLLVTAGLAFWATDAAKLLGIGSHEASTLINTSGTISISGVVLCGLIVASLGALNDVTITQASAVWELYELSPGTSAGRLFTSAMRIGRDHIASTVYTIAFAYAGAALPVLIIVMLYERPFLDTLTSAELAEEVVRTLIGSIGLVLAIPLTTLVAVLVVKATDLRRHATEDGHDDGEPHRPHDDALAAIEGAVLTRRELRRRR